MNLQHVPNHQSKHIVMGCKQSEMATLISLVHTFCCAIMASYIYTILHYPGVKLPYFLLKSSNRTVSCSSKSVSALNIDLIRIKSSCGSMPPDPT